MSFRSKYCEQLSPSAGAGGQDYESWWSQLNQDNGDKLTDAGIEALFSKIEFSPDSFEAIVFLCLMSGDTFQSIEKNNFIGFCTDFGVESMKEVKSLIETVQGQILTNGDVYKLFCSTVGQYISIEGKINFNPEESMTVAYFTLIFVAAGKFKLAKKWLLYVNQKQKEDGPPELEIREWNTLTELLWESAQEKWNQEKVQSWYEDHQDFEGGQLDYFVENFSKVPDEFENLEEEEVEGAAS